MEIDATPKKFLTSEKQQKGDMYLIDTFATGKQYLVGSGRRFMFEQERGRSHSNLYYPPGCNPEKLRQNNVKYIALEQGAYATTSPIILKKPYIRDSVCGAAILRCKLATQKKRLLSSDDILERGEIGGMMHFADLQLKYNDNAAQYFVYADTFDPLVDDGWTIVPEPEKKVAKPEVETRPELEEESPSKKRKTG